MPHGVGVMACMAWMATLYHAGGDPVLVSPTRSDLYVGAAGPDFGAAAVVYEWSSCAAWAARRPCRAVLWLVLSWDVEAAAL